MRIVGTFCCNWLLISIWGASSGAQITGLPVQARPTLATSSLVGAVSETDSVRTKRKTNEALYQEADLPVGEYSLEHSFKGTVKTIHMPAFLAELISHNKLPAPFKKWQLSLDSAIVSESQVLLFTASQNDIGSAKTTALVLKDIPKFEDLVGIDSVKGFEGVVGKAHETNFKDIVISDILGITTIETSCQWSVCKVEPDSIRYVRIVLFLKGPSLENLKIEDKWIQEATLQPNLTDSSKRERNGEGKEMGTGRTGPVLDEG